MFVCWIRTRQLVRTLVAYRHRPETQKRPWKKSTKQRIRLIIADCVFFREINSSQKYAYFCDLHKCWLCPLEAADRPWTQTAIQTANTRTHTHTHTRSASRSHLIPSVRCTALHFECPACPHCKQHTHEHTHWLYVPPQDAQGRHATNVTHAHSLVPWRAA